MGESRPARILVFANTAWNLLNFRRRLIVSLVEAGHEVIAAAPPDPAMEPLAALGCRTVPVAIDPRGTSPLRDLALLARVVRLLRDERPDVALTYTIKPNIYGAIAARLCGVPVVATVTGLGTAFLADSVATRVVKPLYRLAFASPRTVFFQNADDRDLFVQAHLVAPQKCALVPGSGVDLARFCPAPLPQGRATTFLFIGRLLAEKGIGEFLEAARLVRARHPDVRFALLGSAPDGTRLGDGVTYLGTTDDVRPFIADADAIVLPSYREGTSRALLEAAAMARPLLASDVPGCREAVDDGRNGFLFEAASGPALAQACETFLALPEERRAELGRHSRRIAEQRFDERIVVERTHAAIEAALTVRRSAAVPLPAE